MLTCMHAHAGLGFRREISESAEDFRGDKYTVRSNSAGSLTVTRFPKHTSVPRALRRECAWRRAQTISGEPEDEMCKTFQVRSKFMIQMGFP